DLYPSFLLLDVILINNATSLQLNKNTCRSDRKAKTTGIIRECNLGEPIVDECYSTHLTNKIRQGQPNFGLPSPVFQLKYSSSSSGRRYNRKFSKTRLGWSMSGFYPPGI